jgi:transposase
MDGSIDLRPSQRKQLLETYRKSTDPHLRLRSHILLLLAGGHSWVTISVMLFCSTATIARWKKRFDRGGVEAVLNPATTAGRPAVFWTGWAAVVLAWVKDCRPLNFGYVRSRWCCATLALVLLDVHHVTVSIETIRRWLGREQMVWRRPRPVLERKDSNRSRKLRAIRQLLGEEKGTFRLCRKPASALRSSANRKTYYWYHDYQQVAKDGGDGRAGYWQGSFQRLFPQVQSQKVHPTPTVRLPRAQGV